MNCVYGHKLQSGEKAMVLCFVEFVDEKCALTAMEALQGMKNVFLFLIFLLEMHRALKSHML